MAEEMTIRPAAPEDAKAMIDYMNRVGGESDNLTFGQGEAPIQDVDAEAAWIEAINAQDGSGILLLGWVDGLMGPELAAMGDVVAGTRSHVAHAATMGLSVRRSHWHRGHGTQMAKALLRHAILTPGIKVLELDVRDDNTHAIEIYRKLNFDTTGRRRAAFAVDGQYHDLLVMSRFV